MAFNKKQTMAAALLVSGVIMVWTIGVSHQPAKSVPVGPAHWPVAMPAPLGQVKTADDPPNGTPYTQTAASQPPKPTAVVAAATQPLPPPTVTKPTDPPGTKYITVDNVTYPVRSYTMLDAPDDPQASQWWVSNAKFDQAWLTPAGAKDTVLAIIDSGIAMNHEEFSGRIFSNSGEQGPTATELPSSLNCTDQGLAIDQSCNLVDDNDDGIVDNESGPATYENPSRLNCTDQGKALDKSCNNIDDDSNSLVDDVHGWDFVNFDNAPQAGELDPAGAGTTHGSRVAGLAAATGNNSIGIAGSDWHTKILPIQALSDEGLGNTYDVGRAILYAVKMHASVINLSLGSQQPDDYVRAAIKTATKAGILVVAAAGNSGTPTCGCMLYPANYPEVLSVGASDTNGNLASFSSYGPNLDIIAPGVNMLSTNWTAANPTDGYISGINGTSYAAPLISGLMTRLLSQQPTATPLQLLAALTENTDKTSLTATANRSDSQGYGRLDAAKATQRMATPRSDALSYHLSPVSFGKTLDPANPIEADGAFYATDCQSANSGSTPLLALTKNGTTWYTVSQVEAWQATVAGYTSKLFANVCLSQPQDAPQAVRLLDIPHEFLNSYVHQ